jgi:FRG domain
MNLDEITAGPVTSVAELIDLSESLQPAGFRAGLPRWAFRGQSREFGTLVPSFQRQFSRHSHGAAEVIERRLVDAFREHYGKLDDRSADMPQPNQISSGRDLRCLSVMQHYEIPTRLLDWTSDFWTAVYFACATDAGQPAELWFYDQRLFESQRAADPALEALLDKSTNAPLEPLVLFRRDINLLVELDPQISPRMKRQFGHHTVSTNVFSDHAPLLYELQKSTFPETPVVHSLRRVKIDGGCKSRALQFLADHKQITASTIFPDVVGLGRFLRWQFESLRTMLL